MSTLNNMSALNLDELIDLSNQIVYLWNKLIADGVWMFKLFIKLDGSGSLGCIMQASIDDYNDIESEYYKESLDWWLACMWQSVGEAESSLLKEIDRLNNLLLEKEN